MGFCEQHTGGLSFVQIVMVSVEQIEVSCNCHFHPQQVVYLRLVLRSIMVYAQQSLCLK